LNSHHFRQLPAAVAAAATFSKQIQQKNAQEFSLQCRSQKIGSCSDGSTFESVKYPVFVSLPASEY
jgi:hypothetical protein